MQITESQKQMLREAVSRQVSQGHEIQPNAWGLVIVDDVWTFEESTCLCPMASLIVGSKAVGPGSSEEDDTGEPWMAFDAASILGCTPDDVNAFISGFDGLLGIIPAMHGNEWHDFGREMRAELGFGPRVVPVWES